MQFNKITAIIREDFLEKVEKKLNEIIVQGISVSSVTGYGEYTNYFTRDLATNHIKIEIFTIDVKVEKIVATIMEIASTGMMGDGIVAVQPVEKIFRVRTKHEIISEEF